MPNQSRFLGPHCLLPILFLLGNSTPNLSMIAATRRVILSYFSYGFEDIKKKSIYIFFVCQVPVYLFP
uniref:Uncharacterized protein n=1 Tax=Pararge aegeria TaxID=116150 RepID=S4PXC9_9NEOP